MQVNPINNNNPNFNAILFGPSNAKQKFLAKLKKQSLADFNESMNIIKIQHENTANIYIKVQPKKKQQPGALNLYATIRDEIVEASGSMLAFLKACAQKADSYKLKDYQKATKDGYISGKDVRGVIYAKAIEGLRGSEFPKSLTSLNK